ncbi:MAG: Do family serine endopeptidase [Chitinivibrionales bacterium]|nr:Do family serine endopeptidase [Chitinivibrionales bacterium]MBD3356310.1 Do family serine endopeptidase [Chitinivibrionales bacterium]
MQSLRRNSLLLLGVLALGILLGIVVRQSYTQSPQERPRRGSIEFGRSDPPIEWKEEEIRGFKDVYVRISKEVIPPVVSIIPTRIDTVLFFKNPFRRFFGDDPFGFFFGPENGEPPVERRERRVQGLGSGVIVSPEGYILTNSHVVTGAEEIEVRLPDDRVFEAMIVGADTLSDVAVIKITGDIPRDLPVAYLGDSDSIQPGDWVAAIGSPFSLTSTVTSGIVSALGRQVGPVELYQNFIQTDAAINPGNSGGPLVDIRGAVIGINTMIFSQTGGFMGIGFAIPINMARRVMEDLIYEGEVIRGWIGVTIQDLTPEARKALGLETMSGALVADVVKDRPADKAGLKAGDVIVSIAGREVVDANGLKNIVASLEPGERVPVTIIRDEKQRTLQITIAKRTTQPTSEQEPEEPEGPETQENLGLELQTLTPELREQLGLPETVQGVVVSAIAPNITDARSQLRSGDVIVRAKTEGSSWTNIRSIRDFRRFAQNVKPGESVILFVRRGDGTFLVPFETPR